MVAESGVTRLDSGEPSPDFYDGTASFVRPRGNGSVLVANHEIREPGSFTHGVPQVPGFVYDPGVNGGTTTIEVDRTAAGCASTSAWPAPAPTAPAARRRGTPG